MPRLLPILAMLTAGALSACAPRIESARFRAAPAPTRAEDVRVFSASVPDCPHEELGIVTGPATDLFTGLQSIIDGMRRRGAEMGGDALINLRPAGERAGGVLKTGDGLAKTGYIATVVRFTAECGGP